MARSIGPIAGAMAVAAGTGIAGLTASRTAGGVVAGLALGLAGGAVLDRRSGDAGRHAGDGGRDALTGLWGREALTTVLDAALAESEKPLAVLFCDLDQFKAVNDSFGHYAGDELLQTVSARFSGAIRQPDVISRFGGDEFVVICRDADAPAARAVAERLQQSLAQPFHLQCGRVTIGVSVGIAIAEPDSTAETLLRDADTAMYRAKASGRRRVAVYDAEVRQSVLRRAETEEALRAGLGRGEITPHFQPQVDLRTGDIVASEALARWDRPGIGQVPAELFIPVAEEADLVGLVDRHVLQIAAAASATTEIPVWVNVSAAALADEDLVEQIRAVMAETAASPERVGLEVTESALLRDPERAIDMLHHLRDDGHRIALDDFGTGYSSLRHLQKLPADCLKIDRSLTRELGEDNRTLAIVTALVDLGHTLGMEICAEGIESDEQLLLLRSMGCDTGQGLLLGAPAPHVSSVSALVQQPPRRDRPLVLAVDDDPDMVRLYELTLRPEGFDVVAAADGRSALSEARTQRPDVIVLDVGLPGRGGLCVLSDLQRTPELASTPVIVVSGHVQTELPEDSHPAGPFAYLRKPVRAAILVETIRRALQSSTRGSGATRRGTDSPRSRSR